MPFSPLLSPSPFVACSQSSPSLGILSRTWLASSILICACFAESVQGQSAPRSYGDPAIVQPRGMSIQPSRSESEQEAAPYSASGLPPASPAWQSTPQPATQPATQFTKQQSTQQSIQPTSLPQPDPNVQAASYTTPASLPSLSQTSSTTASVKSNGIALRAPKSPKDGEVERPSSSLGTFFSVLFSLGIVLSMFLGLAWLYRKSQPQGTAKLPLELVQVLGRTNIAPRQSMMVVRFGSKLLLVSQQPGQTETLAEISDPEEVDRLAGICESKTARSASQSFSNVLLQVAGANK